MSVRAQNRLFIREVREFGHKTVPEEYRDAVWDLAVDVIKEAQAATPISFRRGGQHMNELWMITANAPHARRKSRWISGKPRPFKNFFIINDAYWSGFVENGTIKMPGRFIMRKAVAKAQARLGAR